MRIVALSSQLGQPVQRFDDDFRFPYRLLGPLADVSWEQSDVVGISPHALQTKAATSNGDPIRIWIGGQGSPDGQVRVTDREDALAPNEDGRGVVGGVVGAADGGPLGRFVA